LIDFITKLLNLIKKGKDIFNSQKQIQLIFMMVLASVLFSLMAVIIKSLSDFPLMEVIFLEVFLR